MRASCCSQGAARVLSVAGPEGGACAVQRIERCRVATERVRPVVPCSVVAKRSVAVHGSVAVAAARVWAGALGTWDCYSRMLPNVTHGCSGRLVPHGINTPRERGTARAGVGWGWPGVQGDPGAGGHMVALSFHVPPQSVTSEVSRSSAGSRGRSKVTGQDPTPRRHSRVRLGPYLLLSNGPRASVCIPCA